MKLDILTKLTKDTFSIELFEIIFPQIKKIKSFSNLNEFAKIKVKEKDFIFLLSVLIIDGTDNTDYFIFKFNLSKEDRKRLKIIDNFYKDKITTNSFTEKNLNKFFYYHGKQSVIDILSYRLFHMKKIDKKLHDYIDEFQSKIAPVMPVNAKFLMDKYNFSEGKNIGIKLKDIEEEWIKNNFNLTNKQIDKIISR